MIEVLSTVFSNDQNTFHFKATIKNEILLILLNLRLAPNHSEENILYLAKNNA